MQVVPPGGGVPYVLRFTERAMVQPGVQEVRITAKGVEVTREMEEAEGPVVDVGGDVDIEFLFEHIELLTAPYNPELHGTAALFSAARRLATQRKVAVRWIVIPSWKLVSAWLGLEDSEPPKAVWGLEAVYVAPSVTNERVILLGAPEHRYWLSDTVAGITVDMGV
jgi:hypothetical protein